MANIDLIQAQQLPGATVIRYRDMGDGTHALVIATGPLPAGDANIGNVDIVTLPPLVAGDANIGNVDIVTMPNVVIATMPNVVLEVPATWDFAAVSGNVNGDNELVALVPALRIYVTGITLIAQGDVDVVLESGPAGPDLTGAMSLAADGNGFVWPIAPIGWYCRTDVGESLNMRLNAAVFVTGIVQYYTAP